MSRNHLPQVTSLPPLLSFPLTFLRFGSRTVVPSKGNRNGPLRNPCKDVWCQDRGFSQTVHVVVWWDSSSALTPYHAYPNFPQCCPLLISRPIQQLALSWPALQLPLQRSLSGSTRTGTASWGTLERRPPACPMPQCFPWPLFQRLSQLYTGTRAHFGGGGGSKPSNFHYFVSLFEPYYCH